MDNTTLFNISSTVNGAWKTNTTEPDVDVDVNVTWRPPEFDATPANILVAIVLTAVVIMTSLGNLIVLIAFIVDAKLRQPFNLYIMNLAVTDFLVGITAMSFYSIDTVLGYWPFGQVMCGVWIYFDFAMTFASVFTLVAISLDRFWCVTWAVHYKLHNTIRKTVIVLGVVWLSVFAIWTQPFIADRQANKEVHYCIWEPSENRQFVIFVAVVGHYVPCVLMVFCYFKVFVVMRKQATRIATNKANSITTRSINHETTGSQLNDKSISRNSSSREVSVDRRHKNDGRHLLQVSTISTYSSGIEKNSAGDQMSGSVLHQGSSQSRDRKIFVTLTYVISSYLILWFPFYVIFDISAWQPDLVPSWMYYLFFWTSYFNSTLNPFIYAYTSKDFRRAFARVIRCFYSCKTK